MAVAACGSTGHLDAPPDKAPIPLIWSKDLMPPEEQGPHLFFDLSPSLDPDGLKLNVVLATPQGSPFLYGLDLPSGKLFRQADLCSQDDGGPGLPPMSLGFVPRFLDAMGGPQRVVIFGQGPNLLGLHKRKLHRICLLGGYVEESCETPTCDPDGFWPSRTVLIGGHCDDEQLSQVQDLEGLFEIISWPVVKSFLESYQGAAPEEKFPTYRVARTLTAPQALKRAQARGTVFQTRQMSPLKKKCSSLYQRTWATMEDIRQKNKDFSDFFRQWYQKYGPAYSSCRRFLMAANPRKNPEKHWALEHLWAFVRLEQLGYSFQCSQKVWVEDPPSFPKGHDPKHSCTTGELNRAFEQIGPLLKSLMVKGGRRFLRYIEYDEGHGSTGERIYSWAEMTGKKVPCRTARKDVPPPFPPGVRWRPFGQGEGEIEVIFSHGPKRKKKTLR